MTPHKSWIWNYSPYRVPVRLADNRVVYLEGVGSVLFTPIVNGEVARDEMLNLVEYCMFLLLIIICFWFCT